MYYPTSFAMVYNSFLSKITDDMYLQLTPEDTKALLKQLLLSAIPKFQFPRVCLDYQYFDKQQCQNCAKYDLCRKAIKDDEGWMFKHILNEQEINIIATYMIVEWLGQQLASIENVRMKYSGADFKFTSQANHMHKILQLKKDYQREGFHLQRLYKRRIRDTKGIYHSTMPTIMDPMQSFQIQKRVPSDPHGHRHCCDYYEAILWHDFSEHAKEIDDETHCHCHCGE